MSVNLFNVPFQEEGTEEMYHCYWEPLDCLRLHCTNNLRINFTILAISCLQVVVWGSISTLQLQTGLYHLADTDNQSVTHLLSSVCTWIDWVCLPTFTLFNKMVKRVINIYQSFPSVKLKVLHARFNNQITAEKANFYLPHSVLPNPVVPFHACSQASPLSHIELHLLCRTWCRSS